MALFDLGNRNSRHTDKKILNKLNNTNPVNSGAVRVKGGSSLLDLIRSSVALADKHLEKYKESYSVIRTKEELEKYIDAIIENDIYSIDTETTSLDPITTTIAGFSMFTPGQKPVYIPINHISYITLVKIDNQLDIETISKQLLRIKNIRAITFNGKFDYRVIKHQLGVKINVWFDGYIAGKLLNENEQDAGLKALHAKYCTNNEEGKSFTDLFGGIPFTHIPITTAYLYASHDAKVTYELWQFQKQYLDINSEREDLRRVAEVFWDIEMPIVTVVAETEDNGVKLDIDYCNSLSEKYTKILDEKLQNFYSICDMYKNEIESYKIRTRDTSLSEPINLGSPKQVAILLYDILGLESKDSRKPRGTGEEIISKMEHPVCKAILEYREVAKLLSTYIDKMPNVVNDKTGRIHCGFNQYGAVTGRFSSNDPNMQNIPSHNNDIRKMFVADDGYYMLSCDYSAQEPRLTAQMCQDEKMIKAYKEGKDLYCEIASIAFGVPYEECLEHNSDGTTNVKGKERRSQAKTIVLGVCYGRQIDSIAEQLKTTKQKAQQIYDKIMASFPGLKKFMVESQNMAIENGYVTTQWGRKRRLPNMQMPYYEFKLDSSKSSSFDPLAFDDEGTDQLEDYEIEQYTNQLLNCRGWKQKQQLLENLKKEGITVIDNTMKIADAERQCVNSRIQGSAADLTKKAIYLLGSNKRLQELGFQLLLYVHDEIIGQCPKEHIKEVVGLVEDCMTSAGNGLDIPFVCDTDITEGWYHEKINLEEI